MAIQRAVVPMQPILTEPATSSCIDVMSSVIDCISVAILRARSITVRPSGVGCIVALSMRVTPSSFSSLATWVETLDCTV
ncbi:MAG: hypothetical protein MAG471_00219 [Acidimicrobiaceae bacterium]|nr:hypothetical protein [Acidimicrobiaceae bacterium]